MTNIEGFCDPKFDAVKAAFESNFKSHGEIGASVSIFDGANCLVDLWGGHLDTERTKPWQKDSLVNVWSTTKGVTAVCYAMAVDRGVLRYEDRVADYWPEFGAAGKQDITIAMLLSHQGGLCGFRQPAVIDDYYDVEAAAATFAAAEPIWTPGTQSGYHAISIGALASALFKRAEGRYIREFVADELQGRMGLDMFVGLPGDEEGRCAPLIAPPEFSSESTAVEFTEAQIAALVNPPMNALVANTPAWRSAEIPSANGHMTARALAKLYAALATAGEINGQRLISQETQAKATNMQIQGVDAVLGIDARWACGFLLNTNELYGPQSQSFGHSGWGGSFGFADPKSGIGVAYTMNRMGTDLVGDPRNMALIAAIYASL